jgi:hypothetical protein
MAARGIAVRDVAREFEAQCARRAQRNGGAVTAEDALLRVLLAGGAGAGAGLIDHDYIAYWVDALGLQETWREVERA